ncbi:hypothetical protein [Malikia sp.]|uniref:hypothetical protein n=1 Tax=Malikia sp. TaxID=2070706 RepID=UPI00262A6C31|nr:hypothetical protein [Malikia sp.]MDD2728324.1 hypothetical protein [Malikia sp.]
MLDESLFVGTDLHEREVEVAKDKQVKLWFKELPAIEFIRFYTLSTSDDEMVRLGAAARLISSCLVNPDGSPAMSYEKALTLKNKPLNAIFAAVQEVNGSASGKP